MQLRQPLQTPQVAALGCITSPPSPQEAGKGWLQGCALDQRICTDNSTPHGRTCTDHSPPRGRTCTDHSPPHGRTCTDHSHPPTAAHRPPQVADFDDIDNLSPQWAGNEVLQDEGPGEPGGGEDAG